MSMLGMGGGGVAGGPAGLGPDGPEVRRLAELAGGRVVCAGYCEADGDDRYNSAVCVSGDGVLGRHRKVHQPLREDASYASGDRFEAFDTPVGRLGMMICYDKAFPEAARTPALERAHIVACLSAWREPGGPGGSPCSAAHGPWRTSWCGCQPTRPARSAACASWPAPRWSIRA